MGAGRLEIDQHRGLAAHAVEGVEIDADAAAHLTVGAPVELITADRTASNHLTRVAAQARTLPHALLCGVHPRVKRVYTDASALIETKPMAATTHALSG